jgi:hypothetical protein
VEASTWRRLRSGGGTRFSRLHTKEAPTRVPPRGDDSRGEVPALQREGVGVCTFLQYATSSLYARLFHFELVFAARYQMRPSHSIGAALFAGITDAAARVAPPPRRSHPRAISGFTLPSTEGSSHTAASRCYSFRPTARSTRLS